MRVNETGESGPGTKSAGSGFADQLRREENVRRQLKPPGAAPAASGLLRAQGVARLSAKAVHVLVPRAATATAALQAELRSARTKQDARHMDLVADRTEALGAHEQQSLTRLRELVRKELQEPPPAAHTPEPSRGPSALPGRTADDTGGHGGAEVANAASTAHPGAPSPPTEGTRVDSLLALAERIELMLKAQRPQLAVHVGGTLQAQVLVERTGRGEVALTVQGRSSPPAEPELEAMREALGARGLRLSALRTA